MDGPYAPRYKGFDEATTRRAQETAARSQEGAAPGEPVDSDYVERGPDEAAERTGRTRAEVEDAVERARRR